VFFRTADVPDGVTKQKWHAAVVALPLGAATAAGVVVVAVTLSVDFFLILNVDP